jgi:DNA polymerase IV
MDLQLNRNDPRIMFIDLNSCFATVEQQANPLLRGKPIVVAAYNSPNGCVVSPSIDYVEYKRGPQA